MTDETLSRIRTAINSEIAELHSNMGKHSKEVQTNAIMMVEGLRMALRIIEEIFLEDGDHHVKDDVVSRVKAIEVMRKAKDKSEAHRMLIQLPSAQPERTCVNCGRTANNGGWYADGRTRCPIEEHYALPKDGYCHLWEKRKD